MIRLHTYNQPEELLLVNAASIKLVRKNASGKGSDLYLLGEGEAKIHVEETLKDISDSINDLAQ